jgi:hypothetical protein
MLARLRLLPLGLIASAAAVFTTVPARAALVTQSASSCGSPTVFQTFLPWGDVANYELAPDGQFAAGGAGWSLSGGAQVVSGGDGISLNGQAPSAAALSLPAGSSATSPAMCVGIQNPDLRFFAINAGDPSATLSVSANWSDSLGGVHSTPIGTVTANGTWRPTPVEPVLVSLLPLLPGNQTPMSFTFAPNGSAGAWQVDDVWVDPWKNCC